MGRQLVLVVVVASVYALTGAAAQAASGAPTNPSPSDLLVQQAKREQLMDSAAAQAGARLSREQAIAEALRRARAPTSSAVPSGSPPPAPSAQPPSASQGIVQPLNRGLSPLAVSGEIRSTMEVARDDFILNQANGNLKDRKSVV